MDSVSVWQGTAHEGGFAAYRGEDAVDVAIVGGGITGVTLALRLAEAGKSVALLEADRIGHGSTGHSTGNLYAVTSQGLHGICKTWDDDVMRMVAESRREALGFIERTIGHFGIDCGFRHCPLYWYATSAEAQQDVEQEYHAARQAGLTAQLISALPLSQALPYGPALRIEHQAQFHPLLYVRALAEQARAKGCLVYEQSAVLAIEEHALTMEQGRLIARDVVLATHSPKGTLLVQAEMVPNREYGIAVRLSGDACPPGIFWGKGAERHSVRGFAAGAAEFLLVVGEEEKTGQHDAAASLARLEAIARSRFGVERCDFRWSAQNYRPADRLPYIGRNGSGHYLATGFGTDGLVYGTLAALIVADMLAGRDNRWAELYKASRFSPIKGGMTMLEETLGVARSFLKDYLGRPQAEELARIPVGAGMIAEVDGEKLALYRDESGELFALSPVCTHMKCMVHWNAMEKSWDCPCHGSRFAPDGRVLEGPALEPLSRRLAEGE